MHRDREELRRFYIENIIPKKDDIYRIVCSAVPLDVAEDITQEVLRKSWEYIHTLRDRDKFWQWIETIIGNEIRTYIRKKRTRKKFFEDVVLDDVLEQQSVMEALTSAEEDILEILIRDEEEQLLMKALQELDERDRSVIKSHLISDMKLKDIAVSEEVEYGTLRMIYLRALRKLRTVYEGLDEGGDSCGQKEK
jgi:RNA polymerase sigma factor (sigma-70 family)